MYSYKKHQSKRFFFFSISQVLKPFPHLRKSKGHDTPCHVWLWGRASPPGKRSPWLLMTLGVGVDGLGLEVVEEAARQLRSDSNTQSVAMRLHISANYRRTDQVPCAEVHG